MELQIDAATTKVGPAHGSVDRECLSELSWPVGQMVGSSAACYGGLDAFGHAASAYQNRLGDTFGPSDDVDAPVDPVGPVDVDRSGWSEHGSGAIGSASEGVACRVILAAVRLHLIDRHLNSGSRHGRRDPRTEEEWGYGERIGTENIDDGGPSQSSPRRVAPVAAATASAISTRTAPASSSVSVLSAALRRKLMA
jgi:hypothetical protein